MPPVIVRGSPDSVLPWPSKATHASTVRVLRFPVPDPVASAVTENDVATPSTTKGSGERDIGSHVGRDLLSEEPQDDRPCRLGIRVKRVGARAGAAAPLAARPQVEQMAASRATTSAFLILVSLPRAPDPEPVDGILPSRAPFESQCPAREGILDPR